MQHPQFERIYINFSYPITPPIVNLVIKELTALYHNHKPKEFYFLMNSPGGSVKDGIALYNFLNALPCTIIMHNMGSVDSIGIVIFMAGDERYMCGGTSFHFHGVGTEPKGHFNLAKLKEMVSSLKDDEDKISHIISGNTSLKEIEIAGFFSQGESKNSGFAIKYGVVSEVRNAAIDPKYPVHNFNINLG